ncbi:hypothetical protein DFJ74DRAFT_764488 [Hyaloraphidium curvatum]|nr:hypothetical protein DFJ74DRAFT_764488 [Hyaloraphidium curvatum]
MLSAASGLLAALAACMLLLAAPEAAASAACTRRLLYVWAGPDDLARFPQQHDFVATLDVSVPHSSSFGKLLSTVQTPFRGTEPHHIGLSADGKTLGAGGLLSFLSGKPDVFFFDVSADPAKPVYKGARTAAKGAASDAFLPLPSGGFLLTLMTSRTGGAPGSIALIDASGNIARETVPAGGANATFNPHGVAASGGFVVSADYVALASLVLVPAGQTQPPPAFRNSLRIFDQATMALKRTVTLPNAAYGVMDVIALGHRPGLFWAGNGNGQYFIVNAATGSVSAPVLSLRRGALTPDHSLFWPLKGGKRVVIASHKTNAIYLVDTTRPYYPRLLQTLKVDLLPADKNYTAGPGPHFVIADRDEQVLAVSCYFVQNAATIVTEANGFWADKTVRLFSLNTDGTRMGHLKTVDFKRLPASMVKGAARPHGMWFKTVQGTTRADGTCR